MDAARVRFVFSGKAVVPGVGEGGMSLPQLRTAVQRLAGLIGRDTIVCPAFDALQQLCTTPGAESQGKGTLADLLAMQPRLARAPMPPMDSVMQLDAQSLERFLATHPDAVLVDVREAYEHAAAGQPAWHGHAAQNVPLSRLVARLPQWLAGQNRPLVFFCRSGNRSARAAHCLHRLGYSHAWHVVGSLQADPA